MKVLIVAENMSFKMGGEAALPFLHYTKLRDRGVEVFACCHARVRDEVRNSLPADEFERRWFFVEDSTSQKVLWTAGKPLPYRVRDLILREGLHILTQRRTRTLVKRLIPELGIDVVMEAGPIAPKGVSFMYGLGVPVVIGPLCGGMNFPPAFRSMDGAVARLAVGQARRVSGLAHKLAPGKLRADTILVANPCTRKALPAGTRGVIHEVVESGVDLAVWQRTLPRPEPGAGPVRFVFAGRFVDWKGVKYLVEAFARIARDTNARLELVGDGELRGELEQLVKDRSLADKVKFHGWLQRNDARDLVERCDVFTLPSLRECGGAVLLEAMALRIPIVCADWGGPGRYVDESVGIRVKPDSHEAYVRGLAGAMRTLANDPGLRRRLGDAGPARARSHYYDWESKTDRVIEILKESIARATGAAAAAVASDPPTHAP